MVWYDKSEMNAIRGFVWILSEYEDSFYFVWESSGSFLVIEGFAVMF